MHYAVFHTVLCRESDTSSRAGRLLSHAVSLRLLGFDGPLLTYWYRYTHKLSFLQGRPDALDEVPEQYAHYHSEQNPEG